jgi:hypothetical protein
LLFTVKKKNKVKTVAVNAVKAHRKIRGITSLILNLSTRRRRMVKFLFRLLYLRERAAVLIEQEAVWPHEMVWTDLEKRKSLALARIRAPDCLAND